MTITLTKEELNKFQADLSDWTRRQFIFVLERVRPDYRFADDVSSGQVVSLMERFEKENPKPDWRTLL